MSASSSVLTPSPARVRAMLVADVPPFPQQRCRSTSRHSGVYDPSASAKAELRAAFSAATVAGTRIAPAGAAVKATVRLVFARPAGHITADGKLKATAPQQHVSKPDADNCAKAVLDVLQGVVGMGFVGW